MLIRSLRSLIRCRLRRRLALALPVCRSLAHLLARGFSRLQPTPQRSQLALFRRRSSSIWAGEITTDRRLAAAGSPALQPAHQPRFGRRRPRFSLRRPGLRTRRRLPVKYAGCLHLNAHPGHLLTKSLQRLHCGGLAHRRTIHPGARREYGRCAGARSG
eukprot:scaffold12246_cov112-Isochrysis_galbana.AAC.8